jgi:hypothetical protein
MTVLAGQMTTTPTGNPEWAACDGRYYSQLAIPGTAATPLLPRPATAPGTGYRSDYWRRCGRWSGTRGIGAWRFRVPYDPAGTYFIKLEDDSADTTLTGTPPTPQKPPLGVK